MVISADNLRTLALRDQLLGDSFLGVYSVNGLPSIHPTRKGPVTLIVNTDTTNLPGQHWIAIYIDKDNTGEVFDSFGRLPPSYVQRWMNLRTRYWSHSKECVQSLFSTQCGAFCLYYLYHRIRGYPLNVILSHFDYIFLHCNDRIVENFVLELV